jgi:large subunit ribosomal protein L33
MAKGTSRPYLSIPSSNSNACGSSNPLAVALDAQKFSLITADLSTAAKSRTITVRVISMAMTGYFKTFRRARTARPMSFLKYDPIGKPFRLALLPPRWNVPLLYITMEG